MGGGSTLKKWVTQRRYGREDLTKVKTQEGLPTYSAASANVSQGNLSTSSKHANAPTKTALPTLPSTTSASTSLSTALPPTLSNTALHGFLDKTAEDAPASKFSRAESDQRASITDRVNVSQNYRDARDMVRLICITDPRDDKARIEDIKGPFLKDSYRWIFDHPDFLRWRDGQSRLLWIKGGPGVGKTVLLCSIINEIESSTRLGDQESIKMLSYFFCQALDMTLNTAQAVLRGLVYLLIVQQPSLAWHLKKYEGVSRSLFEDPNALSVLSEILINILQDLGSTTTYLSIDALDECTNDLPYLLQFISRTSSEYSHVKWIVSSRDGYDIERYLSPDDLQTRLTLDLRQNAEFVSKAVDAYIKEEVSKFLSLQHDADAAIQERARQSLQQAANGTFLFAHLALRILKYTDLRHIEEAANQTPGNLGSIYAQIIEQAPRRDIDRDICMLVLSVVALAHRPLHLLELGVLSGLTEDLSGKVERVEEIVKIYASILIVRHDNVFFFHQSAKEYLLENYESFQPAGIARGHFDISRRSLNAMARLEKNIYNLDPSSRLKDTTPPDPDLLAPIRYSCIFWADHLYLSRNHPECKRELADDGVILRFLKERFLRWVESLSLLNSLSDGIRSIKRLLEVSDESLQLTTFLKDAEKFILSYGSIIERAPLQTYGTALVFCPKTSEVQKAQWKERLPFIRTVAGAKDSWGTLRQTLEGHKGYVNTVAWSPDGKILASASNDCTVRLWDATTGSFRQKLDGHTDWVGTVAFSPDGKTLASASNDCSVRLWDATTGAFRKKLEGHIEWVRAVAFSPDGKTLASASNDCTIWLWDADTGRFRQKLKGHAGWVYAVAFSLDSSTLASASHDRTVRLWDTATGALQQTLIGHGGSVRAVAFSLHNSMLASASDDCTVRLWNMTVGTLQRTLQGHLGWVRSVAFSLDSKILASASNDGTVRLWNTTTGVLQHTLEGHSGWIYDIAFSHDYQTLALSSNDGTIQLWDAAIDTPQQMSEAHSNNINAVALSPDGKLLVSASYDHTVRLWNAATGVFQRTLEDRSWAKIITFSPNGNIVALTSNNCIVNLYIAATGTLQYSLIGHSSYINAIAFSQDGILLASASNDCTVRLWDIIKGIGQRKLVHKERVKAISFSPNNEILASSLDSYTICLWDVATGVLQKTLKWQSSSWITALAFSPDSEVIASASSDSTVKLLDATTGALRQTLETSQVLTNLAFSEDGQYLKTDYGLIEFRETSMPDRSPGQAHSNYGLFVEKEWVTLDGKNLLWLPHEYRPTCAAVNGENVFLGHRSGEITFLQFEHSK